ncbi:hypothetical protein QBC32DRAFT_219448 [Pseudoneurospora amorphoporcata]|uniref:Uncharacterized protein n=1 Tax=Pseudoneurospora amorphoporcata TaxID=241081 RepID=A0AAN6NSS8_9PEZI|nr:hypothetical protein QBC32DRAFT_219448 [Pseudoneurospora amorphoporcata]
MKHNTLCFVVVVVLSLSAVIAAAAPSHFPLGIDRGNGNADAVTVESMRTSSNSELVLDTRDDAADDGDMDSNCVTWTDGHGQLKCNEFSIILGHANLASVITKNYLFIYMLNVTNAYMYNTTPPSPTTTVVPFHLVVNNNMPLGTNILEIKSALNCAGDQWKSFASVLPWTIDIHGGNACNENAYNGPYDNTWVNYAGEHVNVPDDGRCRWDKGVGFRCVLRRD